MKKFAVLSSTGASVLKTVYYNTTRSDFDINLVISDRECGALDFAKENKIPFNIISGDNSNERSVSLSDALRQNEIDYLYLFYTRIISGAIIDEYADRIINFHPSLLPACPGLHGFEDTLKSGALIAGSTVHFIDHGVDTGRQIVQTYTSTIGLSYEKIRHKIFLQQCASLYDVHKKINSNSILVPGVNSNNEAANGFCPQLSEDAFLFYNRLAGV